MGTELGATSTVFPSDDAVRQFLADASDHAGYPLKEMLKTHLQSKGHVIRDFGTDGDDPVDYPDFIYPAAKSVAG